MNPSTTTSTLQARAEALAYYGGPAVREWHGHGSPLARATAARRHADDAVDNPVTRPTPSSPRTEPTSQKRPPHERPAPGWATRAEEI